MVDADRAVAPENPQPLCGMSSFEFSSKRYNEDSRFPRRPMAFKSRRPPDQGRSDCRVIDGDEDDRMDARTTFFVAMTEASAAQHATHCTSRTDWRCCLGRHSMHPPTQVKIGFPINFCSPDLDLETWSL